MTVNSRIGLIPMLRICSRILVELTVAITGSFCSTPLIGMTADYFSSPGAKG
jgi:hypothetical protein